MTGQQREFAVGDRVIRRLAASKYGAGTVFEIVPYYRIEWDNGFEPAVYSPEALDPAPCPPLAVGDPFTAWMAGGLADDLPVGTAEVDYASAARPYTAAGWATLPLPPGKKYPPPSGYTGYAGRPPTLDEIERWIADPATAGGNIALRLPGDVVALDIDDHDGDHAGPDTLASLETERGALPATWVSTARGDDDGPGVTGHRFYRVPMGTRLRTGAGAGVDIIQRHHRYAVVAPSVHPEGTAYRWYEPGGEPSDRLPRIDELPELPWAWVEALAAPAAVAEWLEGAEQ